MACYKFQVGDTVSFKAHPYFHNNLNVTITGESQQIPPLMVIAEIFRKRSSIEIDWDDMNVECSCKCFWYSSKLNKFQSGWLKADFLKLILAADAGETKPIEKNTIVSLKPIHHELAKKKSTLSYNEVSSTSNSIVNSHLAFLPPIMQVISVNQFQPKKTEQISKNQDLKQRVNPLFEAKCIWYNNAADKFSEVTLPSNILCLIDEISSDILQAIANAIGTKEYYNLKDDLIQPKTIAYRSGLYFLKAFSLKKNSLIEIRIDNTINLTKINPFVKKAPSFDSGAIMIYEQIKKEMNDLIEIAAKESSYLRLQYKNRNDQVTVRTIKDYQLHEFEEGEKKIAIVTGYCFLRHENRTFRLDRIQNLQELNLKFESKL
ncbi:WYL domain-containing protein [Chitinophagaceae bacterium 26-R-25]|nr:WYL domain-containing protein [Chitinophagaceae bacterium 26-R-25]